MLDVEVAQDFSAKLGHWKRMINERLIRIRQDEKPAILYEPIKYVLEGEGKRIRPILLLLSCRAVGGHVESCLDAAAAVELLHNFTLVHDDIMDQDGTRRGRETVHKKWDTDVALLAGDGLVALAYQALLKTRSDRIAEIASVFTDGIVELCEGQALDREFENRENVLLDEYLQMIEKKTATLLSVSAKIGAIIGQGADHEIRALEAFGLNLGRAFQIQDDLLDIVSREEILGKTFGSDVMRRKRTYLLVHALSHADLTDREKILRALARPPIEYGDILEIRNLYEKIGSIDAARKAVQKYLYCAETDLEQIARSTAREDLLDLLKFLSHRNA
ncbi:MAG: polyprenyl synthetase family protein [bacterium]